MARFSYYLCHPRAAARYWQLLTHLQPALHSSPPWSLESTSTALPNATVRVIERSPDRHLVHESPGQSIQPWTAIGNGGEPPANFVPDSQMAMERDAQAAMVRDAMLVDNAMLSGALRAREEEVLWLRAQLADAQQCPLPLPCPPFQQGAMQWQQLPPHPPYPRQPQSSYPSPSMPMPPVPPVPSQRMTAPAETPSAVTPGAAYHSQHPQGEMALVPQAGTRAYRRWKRLSGESLPDPIAQRAQRRAAVLRAQTVPR